jgi:hypothetical protein
VLTGPAAGCGDGGAAGNGSRSGLAAGAGYAADGGAAGAGAGAVVAGGGDGFGALSSGKLAEPEPCARVAPAERNRPKPNPKHPISLTMPRTLTHGHWTRQFSAIRGLPGCTSRAARQSFEAVTRFSGRWRLVLRGLGLCASAWLAVLACSSGSAIGLTSDECADACAKVAVVDCGDVGSECVDSCVRSSQLTAGQDCSAQLATYANCFWTAESYVCDDGHTTAPGCAQQISAVHACQGGVAGGGGGAAWSEGGAPSAGAAGSDAGAASSQ